MEEVGYPFGPASAGGALARRQVVELAAFAQHSGPNTDGGKGDEHDGQQDGEGGETGAAEESMDAVAKPGPFSRNCVGDDSADFGGSRPSDPGGQARERGGGAIAG